MKTIDPVQVTGVVKSVTSRAPCESGDVVPIPGIEADGDDKQLFEMAGTSDLYSLIHI